MFPNVKMVFVSSRDCRQRSFALVELSVAIAVLAIALTVIASLFASARGSLRDAQDKLAARYVAEHQFALIRLDAADGKALSDVNDHEAPPGLNAARLPDGLKCLVTILDDAPERPGLKRVVVRVIWKGSGPRPREITLESLVAERRR